MEKSKLDQITKAMISAYVWIASADEGVSSDEHVKFEHALVRSPFATQIDLQQARVIFKDMVAAFQDDFEAAMKLAKEQLRPMRGQKQMAEEILRMCRAAVIANTQDDPSEEAALAEIADALGIRSEP